MTEGSISELHEPSNAQNISREEHHASMRRLAEEAMADPDFVADLNETMAAFRHADSENWPDVLEEQPRASAF